MTNVAHLKARALSQIFARRTTIEKSFRAAQSKRHGSALQRPLSNLRREILSQNPGRVSQILS